MAARSVILRPNLRPVLKFKSSTCSMVLPVSACKSRGVVEPGLGERLRHQIGGRATLSSTSDDPP